jgi:hypothetical protein
LTAYDVYYQINEDMKVFVCAVDYSLNDEKYANVTDKDSIYYNYKNSGIDGIDPVLGFQWNRIGGTPLTASVEYSPVKRFEDTDIEYTEYVISAGYKLTNNIGLEYYHYVVGDDQTKDKFRIKYEF